VSAANENPQGLKDVQMLFVQNAKDVVLKDGRLTLALDSGRLDLWPGGLLTIHGRTKFVRSVNTQVGTLSPVNYNYLTPDSDEESDTFLEEYYMYQAPTDWLVLGGGRIVFGNIGDINHFANDGQTQFMNTALKNSLGLGVLTAAQSLHGTFLQIQAAPNVAIAPFILSSNDVDGKSGSPDWLFSDYSTGIQVTLNWKLDDLPGEILPLVGYNSKDVTDFEHSYLVRDAILGIDIPKKNSNWVVGFSADQYIYVPNKASTQADKKLLF